MKNKTVSNYRRTNGKHRVELIDIYGLDGIVVMIAGPRVGPRCLRAGLK